MRLIRILEGYPKCAPSFATSKMDSNSDVKNPAVDAAGLITSTAMGLACHFFFPPALAMATFCQCGLAELMTGGLGELRA